MSNASSPTITVGAISFFEPTVTFFVISYTIGSIALLLNFIEIFLIARVWKHATNFELVLLNLAIADVLNSALFVIVTGMSHYLFANRDTVSNRTKHVVWFLALHTFSVTASTSFVIVVGVERFFAAKLPLKHRLWHTGRQKILKSVLIMWAFDILIAGVTIAIDYLTNGTSHMIASRDLAYFMASFLTTGLVLVSILYIWLAHLVLMRSVKLFEFDNEDFVLNANAIRRAMKKDRATIFVCALVVSCLLICNLPLTVNLYMRRLTQPSVLLLKLNAVANPVIYFFKGYLEKYYGKKKLIKLSNTKYLRQEKKIKGGNVANVGRNASKSDGVGSVEDEMKKECKFETHQHLRLDDVILENKNQIE